ncbi:hypothetical protein I553_5242 [Mycobacterium xenopi 4042]|uniref:Uncharacterized protein n=1 Tax=Mycobacterium xenopi 4042 TaxID=1299334 RepID=X7ZXN3_MYCXE|nr:hypothetical protein I553_5242 [Mycobacterium xenopi 4042]
MQREPRDRHDGRDQHDLEEQDHGHESSSRTATRLARRGRSGDLDVDLVDTRT